MQMCRIYGYCTPTKNHEPLGDIATTAVLIFGTRYHFGCEIEQTLLVIALAVRFAPLSG